MSKEEYVAQSTQIAWRKGMDRLGFDGSVEDFQSEVKKHMEALQNLGLRIVPYSKIINVNIAAQEFIEETFRGLIFRVYVPNEQLWANEVDKLLNLFQDYLRRIQQKSVTLDEQKTAKGRIYNFYSATETIQPDELLSLLQRFTSLMEIIGGNPQRAAEVMKKKGISEAQLRPIFDAYSKEARRLILDIEQEKEKQLLSIRHRLESELLDLAPQQSHVGHMQAANHHTQPPTNLPIDFFHMMGGAGKGSTVFNNAIFTVR